MLPRWAGHLRRRLNQVGLVQFERDCLVAQRFAEFDLDRVHKRTTGPTLFIRSEPQPFRGLPLGDEEGASADGEAIVVVVTIALEQEITRQGELGEQRGHGCLTIY